MLVSIQKWFFSTISASIIGAGCAAYASYAFAQPLDFLDLAKSGTRVRGLRVAKKNPSFLIWKPPVPTFFISEWALC
jgi:hypothetical protein